MRPARVVDSPSLTFDTSALVALQRRRAGIRAVVREAREGGTEIIVPANVLAEWWRGGARGQSEVLASFGRSLKIKEVTEAVARLAGQALAWYGRQTDDRITASVTIDATVLATACLFGRASSTSPATIYTGDADDLSRLSGYELVVGVLLSPP